MKRSVIYVGCLIIAALGLAMLPTPEPSPQGEGRAAETTFDPGWENEIYQSKEASEDRLLAHIDLTSLGGDVRSVAVQDNLIAVAVAGGPGSDAGVWTACFDLSGAPAACLPEIRKGSD